MKTQVEFRSSKFPPYEGEQEQINPGLWGKRLAQYLVERLAEKGINSDGMIAEDWGWYVPIQNEGFRLALCCGHQDGDDDEFLVFTDPSTPVVKKLFKRIDATAQLTRLTEALRQILSSDPDIRDIVWKEIIVDRPTKRSRLGVEVIPNVFTGGNSLTERAGRLSSSRL